LDWKKAMICTSVILKKEKNDDEPGRPTRAAKTENWDGASLE
jgi:hypothetical protein